MVLVVIPRCFRVVTIKQYKVCIADKAAGFLIDFTGSIEHAGDGMGCFFSSKLQSLLSFVVLIF